MTLRAQIAADVANVVLNAADFAESVVYTPGGGPAGAGGAAVTIRAIVSYEPVAETEQPDGRGTLRVARLRIAADAANGVAEPALHDVVEIAGVEWSVAEYRHGNTGMHELVVQRFESVEKSRRDYRLNRS